MGEKAEVGLSKTKMVKKAEAGQIGSKLVKTGQSFCKTESKWVKAGQNLNNLAQAVKRVKLVFIGFYVWFMAYSKGSNWRQISQLATFCYSAGGKFIKN